MNESKESSRTTSHDPYLFARRERPNLITNHQLDKTLKQEIQEISNRLIEEASNEVEINLRTTINGQMEYHKSMEQISINEDDKRIAAYHAIRWRIYRQIIDRYALSNSYPGR